MRDWVEEFASMCDPSDKKGCSDQQVKFIEKWSGNLGGGCGSVDFSSQRANRVEQ